MLKEGTRAVIEKDSYPVLPIFRMLQEEGNIAEEMMYNTFNMGLGMILAVAPQKADEVAQLLADAGEEVYIVGQVVPGVGKVVYLDEEELFAAYSEDEEVEED